jgi:hypothetical protein
MPLYEYSVITAVCLSSGAGLPKLNHPSFVPLVKVWRDDFFLHRM